MKIEIVYFSGTGNTWWVVDKLKSALEKRGHEVKMIAYESKERNTVPTKDAELFGIAFPTHAHGAPINMESYANGINAKKGLRFFVLTTYWLHTGPTAMNYANILKRRGMEPVLAAGVKMPLNIYLPLFPFDKWTPTKPKNIPKIKERALKRIEIIANALHKGTKILEKGNSLANFLLGNKLEPIFFRRSVITQVNKNKLLKVSSSCIGCGECVNLCPVQNIKMTDEGIQFDGKCILCARCWTFCPKNAIVLGNIPLTPDKCYTGVDESYRKKMKRLTAELTEQVEEGK